MKLVASEPVDARLSLQYVDAVSTGHYRRWPTVVVCSECSGAGCQLCKPEPAPTPSRLRRLRGLLTRKERQL